MTPRHDWKTILRRAWSIRWIAAAGLFSALELVVPFLHGVLNVPPLLFAGLAFVTSIIAFVARLMAQPNLKQE